MEKEKPLIFGMLQRGGEVVIQMLANVQQKTIEPLIRQTVAPGAKVHTDEYDIYHRLEEWGYEHHTVHHGAGEYARDEDGDGFCEIHVNTLEGFWSLLRSWLRLTAASRKRTFPCTWGSSSSFTTSANAAKSCSPRSSGYSWPNSPKSILSLKKTGVFLKRRDTLMSIHPLERGADLMQA